MICWKLTNTYYTNNLTSIEMVNFTYKLITKFAWKFSKFWFINYLIVFISFHSKIY